MLDRSALYKGKYAYAWQIFPQQYPPEILQNPAFKVKLGNWERVNQNIDIAWKPSKIPETMHGFETLKLSKQKKLLYSL